MILTGDAHTFATALGKALESEEVVAAMATAGFPSTRQEFQMPGLERTYYSTADGSVDFMFEDGTLKSVIVTTQADERNAAYSRGDALFDDMALTAERSVVRDRFGTPAWTSEDPVEEADQFAVDGSFQHFIFVGDRVARVTLMRDDPAAW